MAWSVSDIYEHVKFLVNKHQTGSISPNDFFYAWNAEQRSFMGDLLGRFQARSNGKGGPNTGLIQNETILSALAPFMADPYALTIDITGNAPKPADLVYRMAVRVGNYNARFVSKDHIYAAINNAIDAPSVANNIIYFTEYGSFYKFWPAATGTATLDYIKDCTDVAYGTTLDSNGLPVYNAGTSVEAQWGNPEIQEITRRAMKSFGLHFSSQDLENFGQNAINSGN